MSDDWEAELELRVKALTWESDGVLSVTLVDPDGGELPRWQPGAHLDLMLPGVTRQYSLCGDPADRRSYRVAVLREPESRGGSSYVHEQLRPGQLLRICGPRNRFEMIDAGSYLFVAGGIGITPLLPMIRAAQAEGKTWRLLYGGRSRASMAFLADLAGYGDRVDVVPQDERGHPDLGAALAGLPSGTAVYCCGPEGLLAAVEEHCAAAEFDGTLHLERFKAKAWESDEDEDREVEVFCQRSGVSVQVPADCSIVEALEQVDVFVPTACLEGICGSCETKVLDGVPEHRDSLLSEAEQEQGSTMMLCVSRARTASLVLDL